jgi:hypothetical protein
LNVIPDESLHKVKQMIQDKTGIPVACQRLIHKCKHRCTRELADHHSLLTYGLHGGCLLHMELRIVTIFVMTRKGGVIRVNALPSESIDRIKERIQTNEGIPIEQQCFTFNNWRLEDHHSLLHYGILHGSTLQMVSSRKRARESPPPPLSPLTCSDCGLD